MALIAEFGNAESNDIGEWFDFATDKDTKQVVRLRVRAIPEETDRKIRLSHGKGAREITMKVDSREMVMDLERNRKVTRDRAAWAWLDCENFEIVVRDNEAAASWAEILGSPVAKDSPFKLDGRLNARVKARILDNHSMVTDFVVKCADKLKGEQSKEAEDLEGN